MTLTDSLLTYLPLLLVTGLVAILLAGAHWWLMLRPHAWTLDSRLPRQLSMLALTAIGILAILLACPLSDATRGQVLSLLGIVAAGVIAIASTSFVSNAMAGLMLRLVKTFKPGDFIRVGEQFGRVTERGLFHTGIQTEERNLVALPNLYLATQPVAVIPEDGTLVSAEVSLGYAVAHDRIETVLRQAADDAGLEEPFVQIRELGDFSVRYRLAGFLRDVPRLLTVRSNLRRCMMDALHTHGIEIVSPTFMNQRPLSPTEPVIPLPRMGKVPASQPGEVVPESIMFDKAEEAARQQRLQEAWEQMQAEIASLKEERKTAGEKRLVHIDHRLERLEKTAEEIASRLSAQENASGQ